MTNENKNGLDVLLFHNKHGILKLNIDLCIKSVILLNSYGNALDNTLKNHIYLFF